MLALSLAAIASVSSGRPPAPLASAHPIPGGSGPADHPESAYANRLGAVVAPAGASSDRSVQVLWSCVKEVPWYLWKVIVALCCVRAPVFVRRVRISATSETSLSAPPPRSLGSAGRCAPTVPPASMPQTVDGEVVHRWCGLGSAVRSVRAPTLARRPARARGHQARGGSASGVLAAHATRDERG